MGHYSSCSSEIVTDLTPQLRLVARGCDNLVSELRLVVEKTAAPAAGGGTGAGLGLDAQFKETLSRWLPRWGLDAATLSLAVDLNRATDSKTKAARTLMRDEGFNFRAAHWGDLHQRLHPAAPLLVPHESVAVVQGYEIPTKTTLFINAWAIGRDTAVWDAAEEFRPERFLGSPVDFRENLMKVYFLKGMDKEAMDCYTEVLKAGSRVRFGAVSYNMVLDALGRNGRLEDALQLFDRMCREHDPPRRIVVNLGSFNVMVDAYFRAERFQDAIEVCGKMGAFMIRELEEIAML